MSYEKGNKILSKDFIDLKAKVKTEVSRRKRNGDISSYGGTAYDYTVVPASGEKILLEHINKIVTPLNQINDTGMATQSTGNLVLAMDILDAKVTLWSSATMSKNATHYCKSSCTGMCTSGCWNSCTGCTSCTSCSGCTSCTSCSGTCSGRCTGGCTGCSGSCKGSCYWGCTSSSDEPA